MSSLDIIITSSSFEIKPEKHFLTMLGGKVENKIHHIVLT